MPSITQLLNHISSASNGTLIVERVENIGGHYTKALRLWREKFLRNFDQKISSALLREHPQMSADDMEVWRRKWEVSLPDTPTYQPNCLSSTDLTCAIQYYFAYCEAGFVTKTLGDVIITVGREGALELMEGIPI